MACHHLWFSDAVFAMDVLACVALINSRSVYVALVWFGAPFCMVLPFVHERIMERTPAPLVEAIVVGALPVMVYASLPEPIVVQGLVYVDAENPIAFDTQPAPAGGW